MPSKLAIKLLPDTTHLEERLVYLEQLDEHRMDASTINESHEKHVKD